MTHGSPVTHDTRRVCDLSPAELFEAAVAGCSHFGWTSGKWEPTLGLEDGVLRQVRYPTLVMEGRVLWVTVGRRQLDQVKSVV